SSSPSSSNILPFLDQATGTIDTLQAQVEVSQGRYEDEFVVGRAESFTVETKPQPFEGEPALGRRCQPQSGGPDREGRREGVERECNLLLAEFSRLQTRLQVDAEGCHARVQELELELQELQQLRQARTFLLTSEDDGVALTQTVLNSTPETDTFLEVEGGQRERSASEKNEAGGDGELLPESSPTSRPVSRDPSMKDCAMGPTPVPPPTPAQSPSTPEVIESINKQVEAVVDKRLSQNTPEYKALFKEIFSRIQKTKMDIKATKALKSG
ncbi:hypothetical protein INR49_000971, partial [Caranx melampygus]